MKTKYSHKLNRSNILLGIHAAFKLVIILMLFVVLYTSIWIKEKYLIFVKISVYVQIFVFLTLSMVIIVLNNPRQLDICSTFINYFYLVVSILQFGIIAIEVLYMIQNLKSFLNIFHDCPYCRTYEDISILEYKRTCLYYTLDNNNELPYKYICYYNSENEYSNSFCDGLLCNKNENKNEINSFVKCYKNVDKISIRFSPDNEFYLKEFELIHKYKSSNLYTCFRKEKIMKNSDIFNKKCPDSNPIRKMIIFIYTDLILHLFVDFLFIYELIVIKRIKDIYLALVNQTTTIPMNALSHQDLYNNSNTNDKQTYNTDNKNSTGYPSYQIQRDNSQTIIIVPGYKSREEEEEEEEDEKNEYYEQENNITNINKSNSSQIDQYDDIIVHYNPNEEDNKNADIQENNGIINRKAKIFTFKKNNKKNINDENNKITNIVNEEEIPKKKKKKRIIIKVNEEIEEENNRINFFIKRNRKKSNNRNTKDNIYQKQNSLNSDKNSELEKINGNNKNDTKLPKDKNSKIFNNINVIVNSNSTAKFKTQNLKNKKFQNDNSSNNPLEPEAKNQIRMSSKKNKNKKMSKNKSKPNNIQSDYENIIGEENVGNDDIELNNEKENKSNVNEIKSDNNHVKDIKANDNDNHPTLKKELIKNSKNKYKNNLTKVTNDKIGDKENKSGNSDNKEENGNEKNKKNLLNNIHIKSEVFLNDED